MFKGELTQSTRLTVLTTLTFVSGDTNTTNTTKGAIGAIDGCIIRMKNPGKAVPNPGDYYCARKKHVWITSDGCFRCKHDYQIF